MPNSINPRAPLVLLRLLMLVVLILVLSGWTTCSVLFHFTGCETTNPQIVSFSPHSMPDNTESALLTVAGSNFTPQSQIMWNGNPLPTTLIDATTLQTTITQQTFASFGGESGGTVQISVTTGSTAMSGCPAGGGSAAVFLTIN